MRKFLLPLAILAGLGTATAALASTSVGTVRAIDPATMRLTLADGVVYSFPATDAFRMKFRNFKPGDLVSISWAMNGTAHDAMAISPVPGVTN